MEQGQLWPTSGKEVRSIVVGSSANWTMPHLWHWVVRSAPHTECVLAWRAGLCAVMSGIALEQMGGFQLNYMEGTLHFLSAYVHSLF